MPTYAFTDLDCVIDDVHALFDAWADDGTFRAVLGEDGLEVLRLAVHEWIANLVQHASFPCGTRIEVALGVEGNAIRCAIADSSAGFDMATQIERQRAVLDAPAPSERGRGLLMMIQSTDGLTFRPADPDHFQAISFLVRDPGHDFFAGLFRPEDLQADPSLARSMGDGVADGVPKPPR